MRTIWLLVLICSSHACGGGGGGGGGDPAPPATPTASILAAPIEIGPAMSAAEITLSLAKRPEPAPVLLEAHIELPPELSLPAQDRLSPAAPLVTLDGNFVEDLFVVLCGDGTNQNAAPLPNGDLFRLRVTPTQPRTPGDYTITFRSMRAATSGGEAVPLESETLTVGVTVR